MWIRPLVSAALVDGLTVSVPLNGLITANGTERSRKILQMALVETKFVPTFLQYFIIHSTVGNAVEILA